MADQTPLLEVKNAKKYFKVSTGWNHAVDDVSFILEHGETIGVVGESGCGKSTLGRIICRLLDATDGEVILEGKDITGAKGKELKEIHRKIQIVFQDPYSSLNARLSIESAVMEAIKNSGRFHTAAERDEEADRIMQMVGIDERLRQSYPHELDGGRRQRVGIARALAMNPEIIVCDEPVSALDVSVQAQILNLLMDLQDQTHNAYIFITHDLSVVRHISNQIMVMYLGQAMEIAPTETLFRETLHPYTKALFSAIPKVDIHHPSERIMLKGEITNPINPKPGCRFAPRCAYATAACEEPQELEEAEPGHFIRCCRYRELN